MRSMKQTRWAQWAGAHLPLTFLILGLLLASAWTLGLTVFDGTVGEGVVPIVSVIVIVVQFTALSVGRDLHRNSEER